MRVAEPSPSRILAALDDGAAGVMTPHLSSVAAAKAVAEACRYQNGKRGFSNSPRAGGYGSLPLAQHVKSQDAAVKVIGMIEDPEALDAIEAARAVNGPSDGRHHLAHLQVVAEEDVARFAAQEAIANLQALWATHEDQLDQFAAMAAEDPTAGGNPVKAGVPEMRRLYDAALAGRL